MVLTSTLKPALTLTRSLELTPPLNLCVVCSVLLP